MPMQLKLKLTTLEGLDPAFHELYTEQADKTYLLTGVEGMKTQGDIDKVTAALVKERADHKALKEKFALLGDQDPVDLLAQLDRIKELEAAAAGKIDEAKINEIVEGRLRTKLGPIERENKQLKDQLAAEHDRPRGQPCRRAAFRLDTDGIGAFHHHVGKHVQQVVVGFRIDTADEVCAVFRIGKVGRKRTGGATPRHRKHAGTTRLAAGEGIGVNGEKEIGIVLAPRRDAVVPGGAPYVAHPDHPRDPRDPARALVRADGAAEPDGARGARRRLAR